MIHDLIEVCDVPALARSPGKQEPLSLAESAGAKISPQVMNAMPILSELQDQRESFQPGQAAHVINLTLLPLSEDDTQFLDQRLGYPEYLVGAVLQLHGHTHPEYAGSRGCSSRRLCSPG